MATKKASTRKAVAKKAPAKTTKKATKRVARSFSINIQLPGSPATKKTVKNGTTLGDLINELNLSSYTVRLNSSSKSKSTVLEKDDVIRVGIKTKQG